MSEEVRPVHHEYNCETGETTHTPMTDEEWEVHKARTAQFEAMAKKQEEDDAALKEAVQNHTDPVVRELASRLGI